MNRRILSSVGLLLTGEGRGSGGVKNQSSSFISISDGDSKRNSRSSHDTIRCVTQLNSENDGKDAQVALRNARTLISRRTLLCRRRLREEARVGFLEQRKANGCTVRVAAAGIAQKEVVFGLHSGHQIRA